MIANLTDAISLRKSQSLTTLVSKELERLILSGEIKAGERLNEQALADRLGVSRGPVREARRFLESAGLVQSVPHKGVYVRTLGQREILENYDARAYVTGFMCWRVAMNGTSAQHKTLLTLVDAMDAAIAKGDLGRYYRKNLDFHRALSDFADHRKTAQIYEDLGKETHHHRLMVSKPEQSNTEHREIVAAIIAGDADTARRLGEDHVLAGKKRWLATL